LKQYVSGWEQQGTMMSADDCAELSCTWFDSVMRRRVEFAELPPFSANSSALPKGVHLPVAIRSPEQQLTPKIVRVVRQCVCAGLSAS
jgi:hypothetical protein